MRLIRTIALASISFIGLAAPVSVAQARMVCREVVDEAPPPLPEYQQPPIPGPGYIWTPGYWSDSDDSGYYWVPGTWAEPPRPGLLWTPGYWGWSDGVFAFHAGYWGTTVGFYGGVNYGFGYGGAGYQGGYWRDDHFFYNRTVNNISNVNITNVYEKPVIVNQGTRVSYHGGPGGVVATPTQQEAAVARQERIPPTPAQVTHVQMAAKNPALQLKQNNGHPPIAATARPAEFNGAGAAPGHPAPGAPSAAPAMTPQHPQTQGGPLAPMQRAPGQAEAPKPGMAGRPPVTAAPHPTQAMPHAPVAAPHAPATMPHPAPAMTHPAPAMTHPVPAMTHPAPAMTHPAPAMPHPAPAMAHPPAAMPHAPAAMPHPGPAERGRPGPAEHGRPGPAERGRPGQEQRP
jgi:WXXGXW repeat (2 copies)